MEIGTIIDNGVAFVLVLSALTSLKLSIKIQLGTNEKDGDKDG